MGVESRRKSSSLKIVFLLSVILMLLLLSYYILFLYPNRDITTQPQAELGTQVSAGRTMDIVLYFAGSKRMSLVPEDRMIRLESMLPDIAASIVRELAKGTESSALRPTVPPGSEVRTVFFDRGTLYVDFSRSLVEKANLGTVGEMLFVYSIVNSLTEFSSIRQVQILIGGKEVSGLKGDRGHLDLHQPFERDMSLVGVF